MRKPYRTHRERKELYIKALEDEVLRLKEIYSDVSQDKTQLAEENKLLRDMLSQHSLTFSDLPVRQYESSNPDNAYMHGSSAASDSLQFQDSGASSSGFSPGLASQASGPSLSPTSGPPVHVGGDQLPHHMQQSFQKDGIDYEQAGIDFVLTYDEPKTS